MLINFKTKTFRKIPSPFASEENATDRSEMFIMLCDVKDIPSNIPMETNPRDQKLTTGVAKKIRESLQDEESHRFHLLNRGLTLSAKSVTYDNKNDIAVLEFENEEYHGDVDGGHTYKIILEQQDNLDYGKQFVKIEVLTGIEDFFQDLAAARNTSQQVQDKSIAELEERFSIIKDAIANEPYADNIYFKENANGDIDVTDIVAILNMFNVERYPSKTENPIGSYNGKGMCIKNYINLTKEYTGDNSRLNPFIKMQPIMVDIFKLYEKLESHMKDYYVNNVPNKRYGAIKGVSSRKDGRPPYKTKFYKEDTEFITPGGFLYPILGAFRALVQENAEGKYEWKGDPFLIMDAVGSELVNSTISMSRELGNNPNATGKNQTLWMNLYMTVFMEYIEHPDQYIISR